MEKNQDEENEFPPILPPIIFVAWPPLLGGLVFHTLLDILPLLFHNAGGHQWFSVVSCILFLYKREEDKEAIQEAVSCLAGHEEIQDHLGLDPEIG